jgi:hypothetical protein
MARIRPRPDHLELCQGIGSPGALRLHMTAAIPICAVASSEPLSVHESVRAEVCDNSAEGRA